MHPKAQVSRSVRKAGCVLLACILWGIQIRAEDTIPVVVHVIHTGTPIGAPDNPNDTHIHAMLGLLNDAFQKDGPMYGGADIGFHFMLAGRSPSGEATTGINRVDGSGVPNYILGGITIDTTTFPNSAHEIPVKDLSRWPNADYLNLWVVNKIDSNDFVPGGFAYFPEYTSSLIDGIVVRASVVNGENKTIVHEMGHYFSLYHTFGNAWVACLPQNDCATQGDLICDTENCMNTYACNEPVNPCSGEPWEIADTVQGYTVLNNHMGFTDCAWMFTEGQKTRMRNALTDFRPGLFSSGALDSPDPVLPAQACVPTTAAELSEFYGIGRVEFGSLNVYSGTSLVDAAHYIDRTVNQRVEVRAGDSVYFRLTPSYQNPMQIKAYLDLDGDGFFDEPQELIASSTFSGILDDTIVIPVSGVEICTPVRLRVIMDVPGVPEPMTCHVAGHEELGCGQIEDYAVVVQPRLVESIASGSWDNPANWSCGCVPGPSDAVTIAGGHQLTVPVVIDPFECADLTLEPGGLLNLDGHLHVLRPCE